MSSSRFHQAGVSLVELMIALGLGTVLVAGATQIFVSNSQALRLQSNISMAQESGRLGLEVLMADLRRAGVDNPRSVLGGVTLNFGVTGRNASAAAAGMPGLLADSDEITISYRVPAASISDCEGHAAMPGQVIVNRYFIRLDVNPNIPALFCEGRVDGLPVITPGTALIRGVESFQVQYGLADGFGPAAAQGNGFTSAVRYIVGGNGVLQNRDANAVIDDGDALLVASIRVALLVRSESGIQGLTAPSNDIRVLDAVIPKATLEAVKVNGLFPVHRYFIGTAVMRNSTFGYF